MRAGGSYIRGTNGHSNGLVPMLRNFNETARYVDQGGGKRKGSFAMYLEPWHADVWAHKQTFSRCACFLYKLLLVCCLALVVGAVRGTADACATMALMSSLGFASILYVICFLRKWACSVRGTGRGGRQTQSPGKLGIGRRARLRHFLLRKAARARQRCKEIGIVADKRALRRRIVAFNAVWRAGRRRGWNRKRRRLRDGRASSHALLRPVAL